MSIIGIFAVPICYGIAILALKGVAIINEKTEEVKEPKYSLHACAQERLPKDHSLTLCGPDKKVTKEVCDNVLSPGSSFIVKEKEKSILIGTTEECKTND